MKQIAMMIGAGAMLGLSGLTAQAMPAASAPAGQPLVDTVAQGCGPGGFRGPGGFCRPGGPGFFGPRRRPFGPRPGYGYGRGGGYGRGEGYGRGDGRPGLRY